MSTATNSTSTQEKFLNYDNLCQLVKNVQYAVRGKIVIRAGEIEEELKRVGILKSLILDYRKLFQWK